MTDPVAEFAAVMRRLRAECPWKAEQTHRSLVRYLLEETAEVVDAIDEGERSGDYGHLGEELGDLLMQVVFHAAVAADTGEGWDVDDVAAGITDKLVRRNPHVFADGTARTPEEIDAAWQAVKAQEKAASGAREAHPLDGIARDLPALATARKALDRVPDLDTSGDDLGSRLLRLVAEAREQGVDAEEALRRAVRDRLA